MIRDVEISRNLREMIEIYGNGRLVEIGGNVRDIWKIVKIYEGELSYIANGRPDI